MIFTTVAHLYFQKYFKSNVLFTETFLNKKCLPFASEYLSISGLFNYIFMHLTKYTTRAIKIKMMYNQAECNVINSDVL